MDLSKKHWKKLIMWYNSSRIKRKEDLLMKKEKDLNEKKIHKKSREKGEIFVKLMAGFLALLMLVGTSASFIYALMNV